MQDKKDNRKILGKKAEKAARKSLKKQGYKILTTNFEIKDAEIDIIAKRKDVLVFVEVRSKTTPAIINPADTVTPPKQKKIIKAARKFVSQYHVRNLAIRFDIIAILFDSEGKITELKHIENAFTPANDVGFL